MVNSKTSGGGGGGVCKDMMDKVETKEERNSKKAAKNKLSKSMVIENLPEDTLEDENTWDCTVCTFKNSAEAFKCLMCDVRKGTSTRKPRINPELVAQQVARQQQHLLQKISHGRIKDGTGGGGGNKEGKDVKDCMDGKEVKDVNVKEVKDGGGGKETRDKDKDDGDDDGEGDSDDGGGEDSFKDGKESKEDSKNSKPKDVNDIGSTANNKGSPHTPGKANRKKSLEVDPNSPGPSHTFNNNSNHSTNSVKKTRKDSDTNGSSSISSTSSSSSSSAKNGLTAKLKNVDRNNCSSEAVTVNNVTVIITEFLRDTKSDKSPAKNTNCLGLKLKKEAH